MRVWGLGNFVAATGKQQDTAIKYNGFERAGKGKGFHKGNIRKMVAACLGMG